MEIKAVPKSIQDVLKVDRKYIIPRFQRDYTWETDQLETIWNDLLDNLKYENEILSPQEYFVGSLVLVGDEDNSISIEMSIVDGQQRLMTFTIAFSVFSQIFTSLKEENLSKAVFGYVMAKDNDGKEYAKLVAETKKPFFQSRIQQEKPDDTVIPKTKEDKRILNAYKFFEEHLEEKNLRAEIAKRYSNIGDKVTFTDLLKTMRDQILMCKVVYVVVKSMQDAYTIFEVLNAKGLPLTSLDIIKNSIFSVLTKEQPLDVASEKWKNIKKNVSRTDKDEEVITFYRHFWLSKYELVTEKNLVKSFNNKITASEASYTEFLNVLEKESQTYGKIVHPVETDWREPQNAEVFNILSALNTFKIKQVRTFLLALFSKYENKLVKQTDFIIALKTIEHFHFIFTAVCSSRASGLESKYSTYSRKLRNCQTKEESALCIKEIQLWLHDSLSQYETFEAKFAKIKYTSQEKNSKSLVQYILKKIELLSSKTNELRPQILTIEHIVPESTRAENIGLIGNLLPLSDRINSEAQDFDFKTKISSYKKSQFNTVKNFIDQYGTLENFTRDDIVSRTKQIAKLLYDNNVSV